MSWENGIRHGEGCRLAAAGGRRANNRAGSKPVGGRQAQGQKAESISTAYVLAVDAKTGATYRLITAWCGAAGRHD